MITKEESNFIKLVGATTMLIDHIGTFLYPFGILRVIGRLAFPLFAYQLTVGYRATPNREDYLKRLLFFALASQVPFFLLRGEIILNILFSLALGIVTIWAIEERKFYWSLLIVPLIPLVEYGLYGILTILIFYFIQKNLDRISSFSIITVFYSVYVYYYNQLFAILSLVFILGPKAKIKLPKYFFYLFYPIHLMIIYLIKINLF